MILYILIIKRFFSHNKDNESQTAFYHFVTDTVLLLLLMSF